MIEYYIGDRKKLIAINLIQNVFVYVFTSCTTQMTSVWITALQKGKNSAVFGLPWLVRERARDFWYNHTTGLMLRPRVYLESKQDIHLLLGPATQLQKV